MADAVGELACTLYLTRGEPVTYTMDLGSPIGTAKSNMFSRVSSICEALTPGEPAGLVVVYADEGSYVFNPIHVVKVEFQAPQSLEQDLANHIKQFYGPR